MERRGGKHAGKYLIEKFSLLNGNIKPFSLQQKINSKIIEN